MDESERIELLERRLDSIESELRIVRQLLTHELGDRKERPARRVAIKPPRARVSLHGPGFRGDLESWIGRNALLAVGAIALVITVGLALKHAFEQGWISPAVRVVGGLFVGLSVALYGRRMLQRGLDRFGAGLVGTGAAIAYLALWAAAGPFRFVPEAAGIVALLLLSVLLFVSALRYDQEELAVFAAFGAYLAPVLLGTGGSSEMLFLYAASVSLAGGLAAWRRGWESTYSIVVLGYFLSGLIASSGDQDELWLALYLLLGIPALVYGAQSRNWSRSLAGIVILGWVAVLTAAGAADGERVWLYAVGPILLVTVIVRPVGSRSPIEQLAGQPQSPVAGDSWLTLALFALAVIAWDGTILAAFGESKPDTAAWVLLVAGTGWIGISLVRRAPEFLLAGLATLAVAAWRGLDELHQPAAWGALGLLAVILTRGDRLTLVRAASPVLLASAGLRLSDALAVRPEGDPAFLGVWPIAAGIVVTAAALAAGPAWTDPGTRQERIGGVPLRAALWTIAGAVLLFAGTVEIRTLLEQRDASRLAVEFAISAWWLLYAGALLGYGLARDVKSVRIAGLAVGALALGKVVFYDLASLDALYRIGSFALLAGVALLAARAYHRREHREDPTVTPGEAKESEG